MSASNPASDSACFEKRIPKKIASAAAVFTFVCLCFAFLSNHLRSTPASQSSYDSPLNGRKLRKVRTSFSSFFSSSTFQSAVDITYFRDELILRSFTSYELPSVIQMAIVSTEVVLVTDSCPQYDEESHSDAAVSKASQIGLQREFTINAITKYSGES